MQGSSTRGPVDAHGDSTQAARAGLPSRLAGLAPLLAGLALRLHLFPRQLLGGDEVHALRALVHRPGAELLVEYAANNLCRPMIAFDLAWLRWIGPLDEWSLRLPSLLAGLATLVVVPRFARRLVGPRAALAVAWLVALSPQLTTYSLISRSYAPAVLLATLAIASFHEWWLRRDARGNALALGYAASAAATTYTHLPSAPFVLAPLAFAAVDVLTTRPAERGRRARALALACVAGAALLATFLLPGAESLRELTAQKSGVSSADALSVLGSLMMFAGTGTPWIAALFWAAALWGAARLVRAQRRDAAFLGAVLVAQAAAVFVLAPQAIDRAVVLSRYLLVGLPLILICVANAFGDLRRARGLAATLALGGLVLGGPWSDPVVLRSQHLAHNDYLELHRRRLSVRPGELPAFYAALAGDELLLEAPWPWPWMSNGLLYAYQEQHGARVRVVPTEGVFSDARFELRNACAARLDAFTASGADWLVVHRDFGRELRRLRGPAFSKSMGDAAAAALRAHAAQLVETSTRAWGPPDHEEPALAAWDLTRVRARVADR